MVERVERHCYQTSELLLVRQRQREKMTQTHIDTYALELNKRDQDEWNRHIAWIDFREDAVAQVKECIEKDGDLRDLINTLDLNFDEYDSLKDSEINGIVYDAVKHIMVDRGQA